MNLCFNNHFNVNFVFRFAIFVITLAPGFWEFVTLVPGFAEVLDFTKALEFLFFFKAWKLLQLSCFLLKCP